MYSNASYNFCAVCINYYMVFDISKRLNFDVGDQCYNL